MEDNIKLSIAIITYNRPSELKRALQSCRVYDKNVEIIVWDNNSSIENRVEIEKYCLESEGRIKYFYSETNLGVAGGRNAVWKKCKGQYVFFLDDDAVIQSEKFFTRIISYMDKYKYVGAASVNLKEPSTNSDHNCKVRKEIKNGPTLIWCFVGGAHIIRKKAVPIENLYPEKLVFGAEEMYTSFLLWNSGYEIHEISELIVFHLPSSAHRIIGKERDKNFLINQYIVKKLVYPHFLFFMSYIMFRLRLKKNKISFLECKNLLKERYNKKEKHNISFLCWLKLVKKFGLASLI